VLISPTDRDLHVLGKVSSLPEKWGCDVLIHTELGQWIGIQRKAIPDLIASVQDGRLAKEVQQMAACGRLDIRVLLIEGEAQWTTDGVYMSNGYGSQWTLAQHRGIMWSIHARGIWVDRTSGISDTRVWLRMFEQWCNKTKHEALDRRPAAFGVWGKPDNREYGVHLLQGLPNVGPELAGRIYDEFGGVPWQWRVTKDELMKVRGIGKKKAAELIATLSTVDTRLSSQS
jgi:DNA excision repair protein ERCC-4